MRKFQVVKMKIGPSLEIIKNKSRPSQEIQLHWPISISLIMISSDIRMKTTR
jgi:hypothetical protein